MSKLLDASRRKQLQLKAEFLRKTRKPVRSMIWSSITWPIDDIPFIQQFTPIYYSLPIILVSEVAFTVPAGNSDYAQPLPTVEPGDCVFVATVIDTGQPWIRTAGYETIYGGSSGAQTSPPKEVAYKFMGDPVDTVVEINQETGIGSGIIQVWRNVNAVVIEGLVNEANGFSGMPNAPAYQTQHADVLRYIMGFLDDDDIAASVTAPATYINLLASDTGQASSTNGATVMAASKIEPVAGELDDPAVFGGSGNDAWRAIHFALRPAR